MAIIRRKPATQQRYVPLAESSVNGISTGHVTYEIPQGVEFIIRGDKYAYLVGMSFEEWDKLSAAVQSLRKPPESANVGSPE